MFIASITLERGMGAALCIGCSTYSELFETYVEQLLARTLMAGQVVVLDKLGAHRTENVRELVEGRGRGSVLQHIEHRQEAAARIRETLNEGISEAISAVTLEDTAGWFAQFGYRPQDQPLCTSL